ncbi:unnamed protein product [Brassica oleracea]|uniref:(rape) hypothetical protein n=1 Tax=Brassica napus TaxID=3708 RepID=A0A816QR52_BRANA|nr:unnamed protein product [Brassica napus]
MCVLSLLNTERIVYGLEGGEKGGASLWPNEASTFVDAKTACRRSCSYGSRRRSVASLGLSRVVSGRVSKAWW